VTIYRSTAALQAGTEAPVLGVSLGHRELAEADHWILSLDPAPVLACTHLVRTPFPHAAISLVEAAASTAPAASAAAEASIAALQSAADLAAADGAGRAVIFPGVANLVGTLSVADVLALSAIDRIEILGGEVPDPSDLVDTTDFVRPQYRAGQLVLTTMPAAGGRLVPFETRTPTPCCAAH